MTTSERLLLIESEWVSLRASMASIKEQIGKMRAMLIDEDERVVTNVFADGQQWMGVVYNRESKERVLGRLKQLDCLKYERMDGWEKEGQEASVYLFAGETGKRKMKQYLHGLISEAELSRIN